jgi:acetyl-CoA carboxylase carboxyltransferase component
VSSVEVRTAGLLDDAVRIVGGLQPGDRIVTAGANLLRYKVDGFVRGGAIFRNLARLSAAGLPVVTVVHGSSTAGGAYMPGLSDYVVMVRGRARAFLAGPPLLKAATGEIATEEDLGGADMHASVSGLGEYLAEDDADGVRLAREVVQRLHWQRERATTRQIQRDPPCPQSRCRWECQRHGCWGQSCVQILPWPPANGQVFHSL